MNGSGCYKCLRFPHLAYRVPVLPNALRYTPAGGTITLVAETDGPGACALGVSDTGCGIPSEHLPRLFDRFYQVNPNRPRGPEGVGLGLSIVKSIMDLHGGRVEVHSTPPQGTALTLYFPAQSAARKAPA